MLRPIAPHSRNQHDLRGEIRTFRRLYKSLRRSLLRLWAPLKTPFQRTNPMLRTNRLCFTISGAAAY